MKSEKDSEVLKDKIQQLLAKEIEKDKSRIKKSSYKFNLKINRNIRKIIGISPNNDATKDKKN